MATKQQDIKKRQKREVSDLQRRLQKAEKATEDLWIKDNAISSSISPIAFTSIDNKLTYVNQAFLSIWGFKPAEKIIGNNASRFWDLKGTNDSIMRKLRDKGGWIGEMKAFRKGGCEFPVQMSATMLTDKNGNPYCIMSSFIDITEKICAQEEQKRLLRQLQERVKELGCLYEILSIQKSYGTSLQKVLQRIVTVIPSSLQWPEIAHARIVVDSLEVQTPNYRPSSVSLKMPFSMVDKSGFIEIGYDERKREDGEANFLDEEKALLQGAAQEIIKIINQKSTEDELSIKRERLQQADKMASIGILSAEIIHEISNPNNYIAINTKMLSNAWRNVIPILDRYYDENGNFSVAGIPYSDARQEIQKVIAGIHDGSERIKEISTRLGTFARKALPSITERVNINNVIEKAVEYTRHLIQGCTNCFELHLDSQLPPISGNTQQIQQVLINLITNACQALSSKKQSIRITTKIIDTPMTVNIIVADEGVGIPKKDISHVTDTFFSTKRDRGGTGLGLSISNDIVIRHNGRLIIKSVLGKGTHVSVLLPCTNRNIGEYSVEKFQQ